MRTEIGRRKEEQEKTWSTPSNITIYEWSEASKTKNGINTFKQTVWTQAVHNRMRQKEGEIQAYCAYEKGVEKWHKEYIPRNGRGGISEEAQEILEDRDIWTNETTLLGVIHESRKWERNNDDCVFIQQKKGPITSTFTSDWFLREGEGREVDLCIQRTFVSSSG
jgi:hypothetical protein